MPGTFEGTKLTLLREGSTLWQPAGHLRSVQGLRSLWYTNMALDVSAVVKKYILKMLKDCSVGMKALVLDDFTVFQLQQTSKKPTMYQLKTFFQMNVVSVVFSQTELLQAEVATFNTSSRYFRVTSWRKCTHTGVPRW